MMILSDSSLVEDEGATDEYEPSKKIRHFDEIGRRISFEQAAEILNVNIDQLRLIAGLTEVEKEKFLRLLSRKAA